MRSLKKLLAVIVAICVLATFTIPAFAADSATYANADKADKLHSMDLYAGISTTEFNPDLGSTLTREQGMVILLKLFGQLDAANAMTDADTDAALAAFTDAKDLSSWAKKAFAYVVKNSISSGTSDTTLAPKGTFTGNQFATLILKEAGFTVADWTKAAEELTTKGVAGAGALATTVLTRDDLVGMAFGALTVNNAAGKTIVAALVDAGKVTAAAAEAAGVYTAAVTFTAAATGAKILTATFNQAVDTTKATLAVAKGTITMTQAKLEWNTAKTVATITLNSKLTKGDYVVTVGGIDMPTKTATVTAADEVVSKITLGTTLVMDRTTPDQKVTSSYVVYNQYNEDVTSSNPVIISVGAGTPVTPVSSGIITSNSGVANTFVKDAKISVTVIHSATGVNASGVLTVVDKNATASVSIDKIYNADGDTLTAGDNAANWALAITAKDQYGNAMTAAQVSADVIVTVSDTSKVSVNGLAGSAATFTSDVDVNGDGDNDLVLKLANPLAGSAVAGTATVRIISKSTAQMASFDVVVKEGLKADVVTLSAPTVAVAGETITVPFAAVDQFGAALTDKDVLNAASNTFALNGKSYPVTYVRDYAKAVTNLEIDTSDSIDHAGAAVAGTGTLTIVTLTGKIATLSVTVVDPAVPTTVAGISSDVKKALAVDGSTSLEENDTTNSIVVNDQYGRVYDIHPKLNNAAFGDYRIVVTSGTPSKVSQVGTAIATDVVGDKVVLTGEEKGSSTITIKLQKATDIDPLDGAFDSAEDWADVANSEYTFTEKCVEKADITSYELGTVGTLLATGAAGYTKDISVNGVLADGTKVAIPAGYFSASLTNQSDPANAAANFTLTGATLAATAATVVDADTNKATATLIVTVFGTNGPVILTQDITASKDASAIVSFAGQDGTNTTLEDAATYTVSIAQADLRAGGPPVDHAGTLANIQAQAISSLKVTDQYGVERALVAGDVYVAVVSNVTDDKADYSTIATGDTFTVTIVTKNGKTVALKFVVE